MTERSKIAEAVLLGLVGTGVVEGAKAIGGAATGQVGAADMRSGQVSAMVIGAAGGALAALTGHGRLFVVIVAVALGLVGLYELLHRRATGRG